VQSVLSLMLNGRFLKAAPAINEIVERLQNERIKGNQARAL